MKRLLLLSCILVLSIGSVFAQCDPLPQSTIFNASYNELPCAVEGVYYETQFKFRVPDTLINEVKHLEIVSYTFNAPGLQATDYGKTLILPRHTGCIGISGVPTSISTYPLNINVKVTFTDSTLPPANLPLHWLYFIDGHITTDSLPFVKVVAYASTCNTQMVPDPEGAISGTSFYDENGDGIYNGADHALAGVYVYDSISGNSFITNTSGYYHMTPGTTPVNVKAVAPANYVVSAPYYSVSAQLQSPSDQVTGINFGFTPTSLFADLQLEVTLTPASRDGKIYMCHMSYSNQGTVRIDSGTIVISSFIPAGYYFHSSSPFHDSIVNGTDVVWGFYDLKPSETRQINAVIGSSNDSLVNQEIYPFSVQANTDQTESNTQNNYYADTINAADPIVEILKYAEPAGILDSAFLQQHQPLTYTIYSHNPDPDGFLPVDTTAFISIRDTIDTSKLDINSINMLGSSHTYQLRIEGGNVLVWDFPNINLRECSYNMHDCFVYVKFQITPLAGLNVGDVIENNAAIFPDQKPTLHTNTVQNYVLLNTGVTESAIDKALPISIYPNPANNTLTVEAGAEMNNASIVLTDLSGREVLRLDGVTAGSTQLDVSALGKGLYLVRVQQPDFASFAGKVLIMR